MAEAPPDSNQDPTPRTPSPEPVYPTSTSPAAATSFRFGSKGVRHPALGAQLRSGTDEETGVPQPTFSFGAKKRGASTTGAAAAAAPPDKNSVGTERDRASASLSSGSGGFKFGGGSGADGATSGSSAAWGAPARFTPGVASAPRSKPSGGESKRKKVDFD